MSLKQADLISGVMETLFKGAFIDREFIENLKKSHEMVKFLKL